MAFLIGNKIQNDYEIYKLLQKWTKIDDIYIHLEEVYTLQNRNELKRSHI